MTMIQQYFTELNKYKKKYGNKVILLWQCGGFFEVYALKDGKNGPLVNSNIEEFGVICDYTVKDKKTSTKAGKKSQSYKTKDGNSYIVMMSGMPIFGNVESKINKLIEHDFTVCLWKQDEKIKDIREEFGIYSPGTNFQKNENSRLTNNIMCIYLEAFPKTFLHKNPRIVCGLSVIDVITGATNYYEYVSEYLNQSINFDEIERFYTIYNPSEIIIIHNFEEIQKINNMLTFSVIDCQSKHVFKIGDEDCSFKDEIKNCKKQTYQLELLKKFFNLKDDTFDNHFAIYEYASSSFCFLLNFVYKHQKNLVKNIKIPIYDNTKDMVILANHSLKQLNIIQNNNKHSKKLSSIEKFLNNCTTAMGKREFSYQLLHPITNEEQLQMEYNIIEHIIKNQELFNDQQQYLRKINDIDKFYRKIILECVTPLNVYRFYNNLKYISKIYANLSKDKKIATYLKKKQKIKKSHIKQNCSKIINDISSKLILDTASETHTRQMDVNIFKPGVYKEVDKAVQNFAEANVKMQSVIKFFNDVLSSCEKKNKNGVKLIIKETMQPYLYTTKRRASIIESLLEEKKYTNVDILDIKSIRFVECTKNNKKIVSNELNELYKVVFEGKEEIKRTVRDAYINYAKDLLNWSKEIENISGYVKLLDVLITKANLAIKYNYCKPTIVDHEKSFYEATKMRHVLIEHLQQNEIYVPNDISLGKSLDGILLYGTNAVGKSSLIKSIGICIIMAQAGMFVPCTTFNFKPYKSIYTRILGNDDIFKGLSSFAVEMSELKSILKADKDSLILGDELCKGTEFNSAIRIFIAGLVQLGKVRCSHIFATHFHEITNMKEITQLKKLKMKHMSVEFNRELGTLVYNRKLNDGPGNNNYGLVVCKSLGLPDEFINYAESIQFNIKMKTDNTLGNKSSHYNSKLLKGNCELCDIHGVDIHHMYPQKIANNNGNIETGNLVFNKNHKANLMNLCKECHKKVTKEETIFVRKKTMDGYSCVTIQ
jgi:DNA mismatch repair protein MutS